MNEIVPIYFLYAEIHYKLFGKLSFLWKNMPEIIADVPCRVEPGSSLPVFCLIKDAHRFPVTLNAVNIEIIYPDRDCEMFIFSFNARSVKDELWTKIFYLTTKEDFSGHINVNVYFSCTINGREHRFKNDNYRKLRHCPLDVFLAKENLPSFENCVKGDMHYHSSYTSDIVEFGAPLRCAKEASGAAGLDFFVAADHSYDFEYHNQQMELDARNTSQWEKALNEAAEVNNEPVVCSNKKVLALLGEEISCGSSRGENIHLVVCENEKFVRGTGDSALKWFDNKPDSSLKEVLDDIDENTLAYAAHPAAGISRLEKLILKRAQWTDEDYYHKKLNGLQILNGVPDAGFYKGIEKWKQVLLNGQRKYIFAGSDAHGNFNLFRQMRPPLVMIYEHTNQRFGSVWTGIYTDRELEINSVISAAKRGNCFISNGPAVRMFVENEKNEIKAMGSEIDGNTFQLLLNAVSTQEFGRILTIDIYVGDIAAKKEYIYKTFSGISLYSVRETIPLFFPDGLYYIRASVKTRRRKNRYFCWTNPVWIQKNKQK